MAGIVVDVGWVRRLTWALATAALVVTAASAPLQAQICPTPTLGCWKQLPNPEVTSVNMAALKTGKVLVENRGTTAGQQLYQLYDPRTDTFSPSPPALATVSHNMYCSGFAQTGENGDMLFAGGLFGEDRRRASVYSPSTDTWSAKPDMKALRFYPTLITLSRRHDLALDGDGSIPESNIPERYDIRAMTWDSLFGAEYGSALPPPNNFELPIYPRFHVLSTGKVIYTGSRQFMPIGGEFTRILDPVFETWTKPFTLADPIIGTTGVMHELDTIMKAGPTQVWTLAATTPGAQWTQKASLNLARNDFFTVALPDGKVLAVGGVTTPEMYDPQNNTWTNMAPASVARGDHSGAVLLPDGRVIHAGPGLSAEVYSPPYLFKPDGSLAIRPVIASVSGPAAGVIQYGEAFKLTSKVAALIDSVRLIRLGAASHSWDMGQRSMLLDFAPACCKPELEPGVGGNPPCFEGHTCCADGEWKCNNANGTPSCALQAETLAQEAAPPTPVLVPSICTSLVVEAPQHPYQSPPGYHYLFIVRDGVPSAAAIVQAVVTP